MSLTQSQRTLDDDLRPDFSAGRKLGEVEQALLWSWLQEEPECPSRVLLDKAAHRHIVIAVSLRHVNRWRAARGLHRCPGRPGHADGSQPVAAGAKVVRVTPHLSCVGVPLCAHGLDHQEALAPVVAQRQQARAASQSTPPDDAWALVPHREQTRLRRLQALLLPLL